MISVFGTNLVFTAEGNDLRVREYTGNANQIWICTTNENNEFGFQNEATGRFLGRDVYQHLACYAERQRGWECLTFTSLPHDGYKLAVPIDERKCPIKLVSDGGGKYMQVVAESNAVTGLHRLDVPVFRRFRWVVPGRLARSSAPNYTDNDGSQRMSDDAIQYLVDHGITNVISMNGIRLPNDVIEKLRTRGITYLHLPVVDYTAPTIDQLRQAYASYRSAQTTLVYCGYGNGRTGTVIAAFKLFENPRLRFTHDEYRELFHVETEKQFEVLDKLTNELQ